MYRCVDMCTYMSEYGYVSATQELLNVRVSYVRNSCRAIWAAKVGGFEEEEEEEEGGGKKGGGGGGVGGGFIESKRRKRGACEHDRVNATTA